MSFCFNQRFFKDSLTSYGFMHRIQIIHGLIIDICKESFKNTRARAQIYMINPVIVWLLIDYYSRFLIPLESKSDCFVDFLWCTLMNILTCFMLIGNHRSIIKVYICACENSIYTQWKAHIIKKKIVNFTWKNDFKSTMREVLTFSV